MDEANHSAQIVRFGIFEADLLTGELHKNGVKVPLQGQPFQVCAILLKHSGELVSREELRQQVWPEDTFVDFTTRLIQPLPRFDWHWGIKPTTPGSWRLCLVADIASSRRWTNPLYK